MRYIVGGRGWPARQGNGGVLFIAAGTFIDDGLLPDLALEGPPPDAVPLDLATYQYMTSTGGVVGKGYPPWQVDTRLIGTGPGPLPPLTTTHFSVAAPGTAVPGTPINITVTSLDSSGGVVTTYPGTVHFTSTDGAATLPSNSGLSAGVGTFPVTLNTVGNQTVTVTDTVSGSTGTSTTIVVSSSAFTPSLDFTDPRNTGFVPTLG